MPWDLSWVPLGIILMAILVVLLQGRSGDSD